VNVRLTESGVPTQLCTQFYDPSAACSGSVGVAREKRCRGVDGGETTTDLFVTRDCFVPVRGAACGRIL